MELTIKSAQCLAPTSTSGMCEVSLPDAYLDCSYQRKYSSSIVRYTGKNNLTKFFSIQQIKVY